MKYDSWQELVVEGQYIKCSNRMKFLMKWNPLVSLIPVRLTSLVCCLVPWQPYCPSDLVALGTVWLPSGQGNTQWRSNVQVSNSCLGFHFIIQNSVLFEPLFYTFTHILKDVIQNIIQLEVMSPKGPFATQYLK